MKTKAQIVQQLLDDKHITAEEAMTLMMRDDIQTIQYIPYPVYPIAPVYPLAPVWPYNNFPTIS